MKKAYKYIPDCYLCPIVSGKMDYQYDLKH